MAGKYSNSKNLTFAGSFQCQQCDDLHETKAISMTNCTEAGVTIERIPVLAGFWRQSPASEIVRACDDKSFCRGGDVAGDASCLLGRSGPRERATLKP